MPFVKSANWWTTAERLSALESAGFSIVKTAQTLTTHPVRAGEIAKQPRDGHEAGDYVAILARRAD